MTLFLRSPLLSVLGSLLMALALAGPALAAPDDPAFATAARMGRGVNVLGYDGIWDGGTDAPFRLAEFAQIKAAYGAVDVLEISAVDQALAAANVLEVTPENLQPQLDFYLSAIHAVRQVTDDMIAAKSGTILITTGGGSVNPVPFLANINIAAAGLRNWTLNLHNVMKEHGVHVTHVAISAWIGGGHPDADADVIAKVYPELHASRDQAELHYVALDA